MSQTSMNEPGDLHGRRRHRLRKPGIALVALCGCLLAGVTSAEPPPPADPGAAASRAAPARAMAAELAKLRRGRIDGLFHHIDDRGKFESNLARERAHQRWLVYVDQAGLQRAKLAATRRLELQLLPDLRITTTQRHFEVHDRTGHSWIGRIHGDPNGSVILTRVGDRFGAHVTHAGSNFLIIPLHNGFHEVMRLDDAAFPQGHGTEAELPVKTAPGQDATRLPGALLRAWRDEPLKLIRTLVAQAVDPDNRIQRIVEDGTEIDVLVVHTRYAAQRAWLAAALAGAADIWDLHTQPDEVFLWLVTQIGFNLANLSFMNSGVPTRLNMVTWPVEIDYIETYFPGIHVPAPRILADLTGSGDGEMDEVHALRDEHAADLVILLTGELRDPESDVPGLCGLAKARQYFSIASWPDGEKDFEEYFAARAFTVIEVFCAPTLILAHEVGHLMGGLHDRFTYGDVPYDSSRFWPDGYGFTLHHPTEPRAVRTIMSYPDDCEETRPNDPCPWIARWSNPDDFSQFGLPLGIPWGAADAADNRRVLSETRVPVSRYRWWGCRIVNCGD